MKDTDSRYPGAPCLGATAVMFPDEEDTAIYPAGVQAAKAVCAVCPAETHNLCLADNWAEPFGVAGGMAQEERLHARRKLRLTPEDFFRQTVDAPL